MIVRAVNHSARKRRFPAATEIRQQRLALGLTAAELGREVDLPGSRVLRVEKAPGRARVDDFLTITQTLARLSAARRKQ